MFKCSASLLSGFLALLVISSVRADETPAQTKIVQAVNLSLPLLQKSLEEYPHHNTCFSCHHQGVSTFALSLAQKRGYPVDAKLMTALVQHTTADLRVDLAKYIQGTGQPGGVTRAGYALLALQAGGVKPGEITTAVTGYLLQRDKDQGFWRAGSNRPPSEASSFTNTFLAIYALKNFGDAAQAESARERIGAARKWLETTPTKETEDRVFQLWGMTQAGSDKAEIQKAVKTLLAEQNVDGGWAQLPQGESDAYATGSVLTMMRVACDLPTTDPSYQHGVDYLLKTQLPDGSWHVVTRSKPVQPYFESGFPHGRDQFISMSASAWAVAALALAAPNSTASVPRSARFHALLDRPHVPLHPMLTTATEGEFTVEHGRFDSEQQQSVPFLIYRPTAATGSLPAVVVLHGTGGNKEGTAGDLRALARRGFLAIAIDARYHGARIQGGAHGAQEYNEAVIRAWRETDPKRQEHPFFYDTVYDLWRTVDYLQSRPDVDKERIGMIGFSMGGIETWLAAATDTRIRVVVPAIGVQSLKWSLENERWQGRANTIGAAHKAVAHDLGESEVNARVCRALWNKVVPGILDDFDCPQMLTAISPRPLLILNGENDPNCPLEGAKLAFAAAKEAYRQAGAEDSLQIDVAAGVGHAVTPAQHEKALDWLTRWLSPPHAQ